MAPILSTLSHRRVDLAPDAPGLIDAVAQGSLGADLGLRPGDRIVSVNDRPVMDALDFQFHAQSEQAIFEIVRDGEQKRFELQLDGDEYWGITFADPTFDGVRICENACPFCFIKQIPKGMRKSLYVMDDDYRYSMLYGSFVTLTNLSDEDWLRIEEQRVSPMHVSVHAMNPELRVALVGNPKGGNIHADLSRLERAGVDFHAQLVLCPDVNDRGEMDRSIRELAAFKRCLSIAGVPVGLTKHGLERQSKQMRLSRTCMRLLPGKQISVRRYERHEAEAVIEQAERWQAKFRAERGSTFFHLGDEFYLMTGQEVPPAEIYDGYPQIEDGIGVTRHFIENLGTYLSRSKQGGLAGVEATIACATLIGPSMRKHVDQFNRHTSSNLEVVVIENGYFGSEINVSGLLAGSDLLRAVPRNGTGKPLYISGRMISDRTHTLLDDLTIADVSSELGRPVIPALTLSDVGRDLRQRNRPRRAA